MRKIIQYMMMALIAVVLASCANDINEESTPTVKSNIHFVVDDFPMFEKPSTRTILSAKKTRVRRHGLLEMKSV